MRIEANIGGKPTQIELPDGSTPEQIDEVLGHAGQSAVSSAENPSLGQKALNVANNFPPTKAFLSGQQTILPTAIQTIGAGYGKAAELGADAASGIFNTIIPPQDRVRRAVGAGMDYLGNTAVGKVVGDTIHDTVGGAEIAYEMATRNHPEADRTARAMANIAMGAPVVGAVESGLVAAAPSVVNGAGKIANKSVDFAKSIPQGIENRRVGFSALKPDDIDSMLSQHHDLTSNLYKSVDDFGATIKPNAANSINSNILNIIDNSQINPAASPKTIGAVKELYNRITVGKINPITGEVTKAPITVSELDGYRKLLNGISGEDSVVANKVRDAIDNSLKVLSPDDFNGGGVQAAKALVEARNSAAKGFKLEQISDIIKKADGNTIAIKRGFKKLVDTKGWERGFRPDEINAIIYAAQYGTGEAIERGLGTFGLDIGRTKNVALPVLAGGSAALGLPGGVPLVAAGTVARQSGKLAARGKAQNVLNLINKR